MIQIPNIGPNNPNVPPPDAGILYHLSPKPKEVQKGEKPMPTALESNLSELEEWVVGNRKDAQKDAIRFWILKTPAIVMSASSGVFAYLSNEWQIIAVVAGAIASLCILIDGLNPGGMLRNVHIKACHDLRNLQHEMVAQWRVGILNNEKPDELAAKIIKSIQPKREQIAKYLREAETMLGAKQKI